MAFITRCGALLAAFWRGQRQKLAISALMISAVPPLQVFAEDLDSEEDLGFGSRDFGSEMDSNDADELSKMGVDDFERDVEAAKPKSKSKKSPQKNLTSGPGGPKALASPAPVSSLAPSSSHADLAPASPALIPASENPVLDSDKSVVPLDASAAMQPPDTPPTTAASNPPNIAPAQSSPKTDEPLAIKEPAVAASPAATQPAPPAPTTVEQPATQTPSDAPQSVSAPRSDASSSPALRDQAPVEQDITVVAEKVAEPNEFAGAPFIPGGLRNVANGEAPEEYIVEPGDTLFDICSQLLDEGGYWPKLWSVNPQIKNPHFIWPGMRLAFYPGDSETPPFLEVAAEEDLIPIDKGNLVETELLHGKVPEMDKSMEILSPEVTESNTQMQETEVSSQLSVVGALFAPVDQRVTIPGFILPEKKEPLGTILSGVEGEAMAGDSRQLLIDYNEPLQIGSTYTVLRYLGKIQNPVNSDFVGYQYEFVGNVKVSSNIVDEDISVAEVTQNRIGVEISDIIVPFMSTTRVLPAKNDVTSVKALDGNVIAFEHEGQKIGGEGQMLFVNHGNSNGVSVGEFIRIYSTPGHLAPSAISKKMGDLKIPIAVVRIIDTTPVAAIGYVIQNTREVRVGDSLGKG